MATQFVRRWSIAPSHAALITVALLLIRLGEVEFVITVLATQMAAFRRMPGTSRIDILRFSRLAH